MLSGIDKQLQELMEVKKDTSALDYDKTAISTADILDDDIKIPITRVDDFMNQVSELGIVKYRFDHLLKNKPNKENYIQWINEIKIVHENISAISDSLNRDIKKLRLVNINILFARLEKIVRDISQRKNKKILLSVIGSKVEIDRKVVEHLVDPIIQIIRNAVDHGIESTEERLKSGKSKEGMITVKAHRAENHIIIEIIDDGRGIDTDEIRKKVLEQNLLKADELENMSDNEVNGLIFLPGFSTAKQADKTSGRGVGLDIVKTNLRLIGGNVTIKSELGKASSFTLQHKTVNL